MIAKFPGPIQDFANAFVALQEKRHAADYDPIIRLAKSEVVADVALARLAIDRFEKEPIKDRRAFCAYILFKVRQ